MIAQEIAGHWISALAHHADNFLETPTATTDAVALGEHHASVGRFFDVVADEDPRTELHVLTRWWARRRRVVEPTVSARRRHHPHAAEIDARPRIHRLTSAHRAAPLEVARN